MIKMVVLDVAGTSINEDNIVYKTLREAINADGYDYSLDQVLEVGAGQEKLAAIKSILALKGNYDEDEAKTIFAKFQKQLEANYLAMTPQEMQGARESFKRLRDENILVVLNTGYDRKTAEYLVNKVGWEVGRDVDALVTETDVEKHRPDPDMILYAMKKFNITDAKAVVKIGDSAIDIEEGKNAGCEFTFGVTSGAQTKAQLERANPTRVVDNLGEMADFVLAHNNKGYT